MAEGLRRVALAYYARASEDERDEAKDLFAKLDLDEDNKLSLKEFKTGFDPRESGEEFFKKLDSDSDGYLDFSDYLVLFYHRRSAISISRCDACNQKILGPYFSCVLCLDHFPQTYDLCCDCHSQKKVDHKHPLTFMLHDQAALVRFVEMKSQPLPKTGMEELRATAEAHFKASSAEIQAKAKDFFNAMDTNGDEKVELSEYTSFMSRKGFKLTGNPDFFKKLDMDDSGSLDFWEVLTLNYIIKSGRPFCDCCGQFIPATYFTCVHCFNDGKSFDLCLPCYQSNGFKHDHNRGKQFMDNYTLLIKQQGSSSSRELKRYGVAFDTLGSVIDIFTSL